MYLAHVRQTWNSNVTEVTILAINLTYHPTIQHKLTIPTQNFLEAFLLSTILKRERA